METSTCFSPLIASTHTYSASSARGTNRFDESSPLDDYQRFLAGRITDGVQRAVNNLQPAQIGWGSGSLPEQVFNRRWFMKPGADLTNPFGGVDKVRMNPGHARRAEARGHRERRALARP